MDILVGVYSRIFLVVVLTLAYLSMSKNSKAFGFGKVAVTPSYKVNYSLTGKISSVQCKTTGKFVPTYLAHLEIQSYFA